MKILCQRNCFLPEQIISSLSLSNWVKIVLTYNYCFRISIKIGKKEKERIELWMLNLTLFEYSYHIFLLAYIIYIILLQDSIKIIHLIRVVKIVDKKNIFPKFKLLYIFKRKCDVRVQVANGHLCVWSALWKDHNNIHPS